MAEVLQSSPATIYFLIFSRNKEVRKVEVLFHEKGDINSSDSKEKTCFILFHNLYLRSILFNKPKDELKWENSCTSKISFRILSLKAKSHPLFACSLRRLLKVLIIECIDQIPSWFLVKENIGFIFESIESLYFFSTEGIVATEKALSTR